jgi:hypothetical protein
MSAAEIMQEIASLSPEQQDNLAALLAELRRERRRRDADQDDLAIINSRADALNAEAEDVLSYQVAL